LDEVIAKLARAAIDYTDWVINGVPAMFGAMAKYMYDNVRKNTAFSFVIFSTNIFLAFFAGNVVHEFLPTGYANEGGILMVTGFCTYPVLGLIERKAADVIAKIKRS
jgi:undecaprenyl pyrophosphate phosphatase UppP